MKLSIHGSRTLKDERVKIIILEAIDKYKPDAIVTHAEPGGVCKVARDLCQEKAIPLKLHFLNFKYLDIFLLFCMIIQTHHHQT